MAHRTQTERAKCSVCGGDIPPEPQWGKRGEKRDGYCPGAQRDDGMCGAFGPRERYKDAAKGEG